MKRNTRIILGLALWGIALIGGWRWRHIQAPPLPLALSFWYWHQPFRLSAAEISTLKGAQVSRLFVWAGMLDYKNHQVRLVQPQKWETPLDDLAVHLVFRCHPALAEELTPHELDRLAEQIEQVAEAERLRATQAGVTVRGAQFDFDCPVQLLPDFADLLRRLRDRLKPEYADLSITVAPAWLESQDLKQVASKVDFIVPQLYAEEAPPQREPFVPLSQFPHLKKRLATLERLERPYWIGLPADGRVLVYDGKGKLVGIAQKPPLQEAIHHPALRYLGTTALNGTGQPAHRADWNGSELVEFVVQKPTQEGYPQGYHFVYERPTDYVLEQHLATLRAHASSACRGVVAFRYPPPKAALALSPAALVTAFQGKAVPPQIQVQTQVTLVPAAPPKPGEKAQPSAQDVTLTLTNTGGTTTFAPDAVSLSLTFDHPGLKQVTLRDFDTLETIAQPFAPDLNTAPPLAHSTALPNANVLRFGKWSLAAGETARIGPIRVPAGSATTLHGGWMVRAAGGFDTTRGEIAPLSLTPLGRQ